MSGDVRLADQHGEIRRLVSALSTLVAMKLQSAPRRPAARAYKAASDYLDLALLLSHVELLPLVGAGLAEAPHGLGEWCAGRIRTDFVDGAARTSSRIRQGPSRITPDELRQIGTRFLETSGWGS